MSTPPAISMTADDLASIKRSLETLANVMAASSGNRPLLNDGEAAAWLGYRGSDAKSYMIWLRKNTTLRSVKLNKHRRWRMSDLEKLVTELPEKELAPARKPRLQKSA